MDEHICSYQFEEFMDQSVWYRCDCGNGKKVSSEGTVYTDVNGVVSNIIEDDPMELAQAAVLWADANAAPEEEKKPKKDFGDLLYMAREVMSGYEVVYLSQYVFDELYSAAVKIAHRYAEIPTEDGRKRIFFQPAPESEWFALRNSHSYDAKMSVGEATDALLEVATIND